jgi:hypothetical protein
MPATAGEKAATAAAHVGPTPAVVIWDLWVGCFDGGERRYVESKPAM